MPLQDFQFVREFSSNGPLNGGGGEESKREMLSLRILVQGTPSTSQGLGHNLAQLLLSGRKTHMKELSKRK